MAEYQRLPPAEEVEESERLKTLVQRERERERNKREGERERKAEREGERRMDTNISNGCTNNFISPVTVSTKVVGATLSTYVRTNVGGFSS